MDATKESAGGPQTLVRSVLLAILLMLPLLAQAQIADLVSPGELSKAHAKFSGLKNCTACHGPEKNVLDTKCLDCHKELAARIRENKGFHADKKADCATCHTEHLGKDFDIRPLERKTFDHSQTGWKLEGLHAKVRDCAACHKTHSFQGLKTDCASCHKDPHMGRLPNCTTCHAVDRPMKQVRFDHATTAYPLAGAHAKATCMQCHNKQVFKGLPFAECASCHKDPHKGTLGTNCASCHNVETWKNPSVAHKTFPLAGKHAAVACAKCHPSGQWKLKKSAPQCADCHRDPHLGQFQPRTCESCHSVQGFKPAKINHDAFKLELGHAIPCAKCHQKEKASFPAGRGEAVRFKLATARCADCHKDIHKGQFGPACESCHTTASFKVQTFDHSKTKFPLDLAHAKVPCAKCHTKDEKTGVVRYKPLETSCASCHAKAHMGQLSQNCEQCHKPEGVRFDHATSKFPLTGKHTKVACEKCHIRQKGSFPAGQGEAIRYKPMATTCAPCHADEHRGQFQKDCVACHTTESFKPATFEHAKSAFPLTGAHMRVECARCHGLETFDTPPPPVLRVRYHPVAKECAQCHKDPHQGKLSSDCASCHNTEAWKIQSRAFHKDGKFPLDGKHVSVRCESCHLGGVVQGTPTACYDCHWIRKQDDLYRTKLGIDCQKCHTTVAWTGARFNHAADAGVPLNAAHMTLSCDSCHKSGSFAPGEVQCVTCHKEDYDRTERPNHRTAGFSTSCESCHKPGDNTWEGPAFNHNQIFRLVGRHASAACTDCHKNGVYRGTPRDCYGCHKPEYDRTTDPNHASAGFPTTCDSCHNPTDPGWDGATLNHDSFFPLVGRHTSVPCAQCHKNNQYKGTPRNCYGCHKADYDATRNPNHVSAGFPTTCESCHRAADATWKTGFDHNAVFPLVGTHRTLQCSSCHKNNQYKGTPRNCYGCHKADYDATRNPNHVSAAFPTTCESCHKASDPNWNTGFNHNNVFQLVGVHATAACTSCHKNNKYKGTPRNCYGCHKADYDATRNPNHVSAGFPTTCESCHRASDSNWNTAFNHNSVFQLVGVHATAPCASCHKNNKYRGTPRNCFGCHKADYDATRNPNHVAAGFPTNCDSCHKPSAPNWNTSFNHNTFFPLAGVHATAPCASCHKNNQYKGTPRNCYGCHKPDYDATRNPNHAAAGFPTNCDACHRYTDSNWNQGVFNHSWFPITSGKHAGNPCSACHTNPSNFKIFNCLACHQKGETDSEHDDEPGYRYDSIACYNCHPDGRADD